MPILQKIMLIGFAGALGTLARYGISSFIQKTVGGSFPWGTIAVNVFGCFAAGLLWSVLGKKLHLAPGMQTALLVGFMGAFTTFSAFILETSHLVNNAQWLGAASNVLIQNTAGIFSLFLGLALGRMTL